MQTRNILILLAFLLFSATALAGYVQPAPLMITINGDGSGSAGGDMVTIRNSKSDNEIIGCGIRAYETFTYMFCQATNDDGEQGFCTTVNPDIAAGFYAVNDSSYITFSWNADGECTRVGVSSQSLYLEKGKANKAP